MQEVLAEVSLPVRELVEFILASGSIDNRIGGTDLVERANEGSRLHRKLQKQSREQYGDRYRAEVSLSNCWEEDGISFRIFGRADAILTETDGSITIEEIKTTDLPLSSLSGSTGDPGFRPLHWAQAKCYAFILSQLEHLDKVGVRLIYCQTETEETSQFTQVFSAQQLLEFFSELLHRYQRWARMRLDWSALRNQQAKQLSFPFESYRAGQRQMAAVIYRAAASGTRVLCQAPTGTGKTISSLFPAVKAMGEGLVSRLFYLTAKTSTRAVAEEGFWRMQQQGLRLKRVTLSAKDKICFLSERLCNPDDCPYAHGYYDRVQDVLFEMLNTEDAFTRETIEHWAREKTLCPFELGLDLSLWCDVVICDYNYLFDPVVYLRRFFDRPDDYCFLIDEAHNLIDRARSMYSSQLQKSDLLVCKKLAVPLSKELSRALGSLNSEFLRLKKQIAHQKEEQEEKENYLCLSEIPADLLKAAQRLYNAFVRFLEQRRQDRIWRGALAGAQETVAPELLQLYFDLRFFLRIAELFDERFAFFVSSHSSQVTVRLLCLDPAEMIDQRLRLGRCAALFSATLSPPSYYKTVLGCAAPSSQTHSYALPSPFDPEHLCLLVCPQINTRWASREQSLLPIAHLLYRMVSAHSGNYLAYFPSYQYLQQVEEVFSKLYPQIKLLVQSAQMTDEEKEEFLHRFDDPHSEQPMLALAVLGGIYSEGVDLVGERLLGCAVVGTGLPKVGPQQEILRDYYQRHNGMGYDFAYRYPGMNKVLQASGRVIRTDSDHGVVLLLDDRFSTGSYRRLFPAHWSHARIVYDEEQLADALREFWDKSADKDHPATEKEESE